MALMGFIGVIGLIGEFSILNSQFNSVLPRLIADEAVGIYHSFLYLLVAKGTQNHCDAFRRGLVLSLAKTNDRKGRYTRYVFVS